VLLHLGPVYEEARAIASILQSVACAVCHDRRAAAGDAPVVKLHYVINVAAAPYVEGLMGHGNLLSRAVRGHDFEYGFGLRGTIVHGIRCGQIVTPSINKT